MPFRIGLVASDTGIKLFPVHIFGDVEEIIKIASDFVMPLITGAERIGPNGIHEGALLGEITDHGADIVAGKGAADFFQ